MRRIVTLLFAIILMLNVGCALAEGDLGVQVIGEDSGTAESVSLDDIKVGSTYKIAGYATVAPVSFEYVDFFAQYKAGMRGDNAIEYKDDNDPALVFTGYKPGYIYTNMTYQNSGGSADFAQLKVDITNLSKEAATFMKDAKVTVYYDNDQYEFGGWVRQYDYDVNDRTVKYDWTETGPAVFTPQDELEIATMYTGHYVFGCTLPMAVINGSESLQMVIELGDSELTYNIRK